MWHFGVRCIFVQVHFCASVPNVQATCLHVTVCSGCVSVIPRTLPAIIVTFEIYMARYPSRKLLHPCQTTHASMNGSDISEQHRVVCRDSHQIHTLIRIKNIILFIFALKMWHYSRKKCSKSNFPCMICKTARLIYSMHFHIFRLRLFGSEAEHFVLVEYDQW